MLCMTYKARHRTGKNTPKYCENTSIRTSFPMHAKTAVGCQQQMHVLELEAKQGAGYKRRS